MTKQEAIETIKANWPPENYTLLREALSMALDALGNEESGHCTYYEENGKNRVVLIAVMGVYGIRKGHFKSEVIHMGFVLGVIAGACMGFIVTALITANR